MNLEKLKSEINIRKAEKANRDVSENAIPKRGGKVFLSELLTSMHRGVSTPAVEAIKAVNETVESKKGLPNAVTKNNGKYVPPRASKRLLNEEEYVAPITHSPKSAANEWGLPSNIKTMNDGERNDLFEQENAKFDQMMMLGNLIASKHIKQTQQPKYVSEEYVSNTINENQIDQLLTEKLERNLEKMVESAFKSVLTNLYTKDKIQESLSDFFESEEFVKIVGKAINEIAKRNKAKQGK